MTTVGIATGAGRGMGYKCGCLLPSLVDHVILLDRVEESVVKAAGELAASSGATVEPFVADVTDSSALAHLADRVAEIGTLRAVAHAAGISPSMADWRRIFEVDLIGTALLAQALRPLATAGTATVSFASMAAVLRPTEPRDADVDALMATRCKTASWTRSARSPAPTSRTREPRTRSPSAGSGPSPSARPSASARKGPAWSRSRLASSTPRKDSRRPGITRSWLRCSRRRHWPGLACRRR
jgi:NAD(P)-dependent dehydrogenase (short-subunit alcohol dehydrogenase family)